MARKPSIVSMARGGMYIASVALPLKGEYDASLIRLNGDKAAAATQALQTLGGINQFGDFDWDLVKKVYGPVVTWTIIDGLASKFGVYKRVGRLIGNLNLMG